MAPFAFGKRKKMRAREALREIDEVGAGRRHGDEPRLAAKPGFLPLGVAARAPQDPLPELGLGQPSRDERGRITVSDRREGGGRDGTARGEKAANFLRES